MYYNPLIHNRKSIRLKNYDYSSEGLYFITIAIQNKLCLFGKINNGICELFESGEMIKNHWLDLENRYNNIILHSFVVMPNHFHGIIEISKQNNNCDCKTCNDKKIFEKNTVGISIVDISKQGKQENNKENTNEKCPYNKNIIGNIIGGFKSITTNEYIKNVKNNNWPPFNKRLWQLNYYEHIIRDEKAYNNISEYIQNNPIKWNEDKFYYTEI